MRSDIKKIVKFKVKLEEVYLKRRIIEDHITYVPLFILLFLISQMRWILSGEILLWTRDYYIRYNFFKGTRFYVPYIWEAHHGSKNYINKLQNIYIMPGFAEVEQGDVLVDIGAYLGSFSIMYHTTAKKVIAVDPGASYDKCLWMNVKDYRNILIAPVALWNSNTIIKLNLSLTPNDNSVLDADKYKINKQVEVEALTIEELAKRFDLKIINFLKVEAEGAEPEILEGINSVIIEKIVVNCGPERYGKSPTKEVISILLGKDYEVRVVKNPHWRGEVVYARRK